MSFEDLVWVFWVQSLQILRKLLVMSTQSLLVANLLQFAVIQIKGRPLSTEHESQLLLCSFVSAFSYNLLYQILVIHTLGNSQSIRELVLGSVDVKGSSVSE